MNDYDPKMIGKRIKETAQSKGYTAEKLSEITGNGIHTINRIYQGTSAYTSALKYPVYGVYSIPRNF